MTHIDKMLLQVCDTELNNKNLLIIINDDNRNTGNKEENRRTEKINS